MRIHQYTIIPLELGEKQSKKVRKWLKSNEEFSQSWEYTRLNSNSNLSDFEFFNYGDSQNIIISIRGSSGNYLRYSLSLCLYRSSLCFLLYAAHNVLFGTTRKDQIERIRSSVGIIQDVLGYLRNDSTIINELCDEINSNVKFGKNGRKNRNGLLQPSPEYLLTLYVLQETSQAENMKYYAHILTQNNPKTINIATESFENISCFAGWPISVFATRRNEISRVTNLAFRSVIPTLTAWNRNQVIARKVSAQERHGLQVEDLLECREYILRYEALSNFQAEASSATITTALDFQERLAESLLLVRSDRSNGLKDVSNLISSEMEIEFKSIDVEGVGFNAIPQILGIVLTFLFASFSLTFSLALLNRSEESITSRGIDFTIFGNKIIITEKYTDFVFICLAAFFIYVALLIIFSIIQYYTKYKGINKYQKRKKKPAN